MKFSTLLLGTFLAGGTLFAGAATMAKKGVPPPEEPQGISLREQSQRARGHGFFYGYHSRSHMGGGIRGGK